MGQKNIIFLCQQCGEDFSKWSGQCSNCNSWNSLVEMKGIAVAKNTKNIQLNQSPVAKISEIESNSYTRISTQLSELDRVLGGGIIPGITVLLGGDPGIGKSTLLTQVMGNMQGSNLSLYFTAEESLEQVSMRAARLKLVNEEQYLCATTSLEEILANIQKFSPKVVFIDSIQTIFSNQLTSAPGSVSQVRECAAQLVNLAKTKKFALFIIGHVTKDGAIAGPRILEHMVDTVLYFEGSQNTRYRIIRSVKNRFGPSNELGVFAMGASGLQVVNNPSAIFLSQFVQGREGTTITAVWEGSRPILVEIQALLDESPLNNPRRVSVGIDHNRIAMLLAILNRYANMTTANYDVFVNVVGGIRISETAVDLATALSIYSSSEKISIGRKVLVFGEVGLSGEIRPVQHGLERLQEAAKIGFDLAIVPEKNAPKKALNNLEVRTVANLMDAIEVLKRS